MTSVLVVDDETALVRALRINLTARGYAVTTANDGASALLVAATNTGHAFFDRITGGKHALWHNRFTLVVFTSALALQIAGDHGWRWALTAANVVMPVAIYFYFSERKSPIEGTVVAPSPAAEKVFVFWLCAWLIVCTA